MSAIIPLPTSWLNPQSSTDEWTRAFVLWLSAFQSQNTRETYMRAWRQFDECTGGLHPGMVGNEHIRGWMIWLKQRQSAESANLKLSALSSFYRYVNQHYAYLRDDNPCEDIPHEPIQPYGKATILADENDRVLLNSIDQGTPAGLRDYVIILLFLTTAVRLDAIVSASVKSIKRQGDAVFFKYTNKGGQEVTKRLMGHTADTLARYMDMAKPKGSLFRLSRRQIQEMVKRRCDAVFGKGHGITPHALRHTAAVQVIKDGGSVLEVSGLLEHQSVRVTAVYIQHIDTASKDSASDRLDKRYAK